MEWHCARPLVGAYVAIAIVRDPALLITLCLEYVMCLNRWSARASALCILLNTATLAGCDNLRHAPIVRPASNPARPSAVSIPLPARTLLVAPEEPDCELKDPNADERQKLDYERQCYRHAGIIARERMRLLQASVRRTARAINRCQWFAAQPRGPQSLTAISLLTE
jgi:hypothetical protein